MDVDTSDIREREAAARIASLIDDAEVEIDGMAAELTALYRERIPVYDLIARDEIERNTRAVLEMVLRQVRSDSPQINTVELTELARLWSTQQIPLELVAHSIQVGARLLAKVIRERATARGMAPEVIDDLQDMMWHWATSYSAVINAVLQEDAVSLAARRSTFLRRLLEGEYAAASLPARLAEHGVRPDVHYSVACAEHDDPRFGSDVRATVRLRCAARDIPVVDAVVDSHYVALLPDVPDDLVVDALVAVGPPEVPANAGSSYRRARHTLDIAARFGRTGIVELADLGALPLLAVDDDTARHLADVHLAPLRARGAAGAEILDTVAAFLRNNRRVDDTATALFLHRNTVRNRVSRFSDITGLDLDRTDDLVLTWWLLGRQPG
ncbi:PucR family transcriptional regulator [Williamsia sp. M5A3_1d]